MTGREGVTPGVVVRYSMTWPRAVAEAGGDVPSADDNHIRVFLVLLLTLHTVHQNKK